MITSRHDLFMASLTDSSNDDISVNAKAWMQSFLEYTYYYIPAITDCNNLHSF